MKFCFRIAKGTSESDDLDTVLEGLRKTELLQYLGTLKAGDRMHLIVRPRPGFDIIAKRNYFHGPLIDWVVKELQDKGIPASREGIRKSFVIMFVGVEEDGKPKSVAKYIEAMVEGDPRDPETKYGDLLSDVRNWCRDKLDSEPPRPDQVDLAEEQGQCATSEMT